ncbi:hypothetical protein MBAV_006325 [Candidatus Magnetobacterium bavaricum]|uniref:Uncharacterized protein n=1 Tax=Candidatus Magnetobacterium bavaricum TaxID=29290 RepID=A0A0F3GLC3_9BACT|nr:hypothetical protein MBAV_006325 [Candidatus Magnetobacterium bavaricum]
MFIQISWAMFFILPLTLFYKKVYRWFSPTFSSLIKKMMPWSRTEYAACLT